MATSFIPSRRPFLAGAGALVLSALMPLPSHAAEALELCVIVHASNKRKLTNGDIALIFRTSMRHWPDSGMILAFNLPPRSSERALFDRIVLGLDGDAMSRFWIDRKIRGGEPPPRSIPDAGVLVRLVEQTENAIGYVPTALASPGVRIVARVSAVGVAGAGTSVPMGAL